MKFPHNKAEWEEQQARAYAEGYSEGRQTMRKLMEETASAKQIAVRLEALKTLSNFVAVCGQTVEGLSRAMQSEANQL